MNKSPCVCSRCCKVMNECKRDKSWVYFRCPKCSVEVGLFKDVVGDT